MFFEQFQKICELNNTTPSAVIANLKLGSSNVTRWKKGTAPNSDNVIAIANYFNVNIDWLLTGEGEMRPTTEPTTQLELSETEEIILEAYRNADKETRLEILKRVLNTTK